MIHHNTTILVVDDEPNNFDVIASFLEREPYELLYANSARKADQILASLHPDLILLDVMMPEEDGIAYCTRLRKDPATERLPILAVTALDDKQSLAKCFEAGADDFLNKPVSGVELRARIKAHLRLQEQFRKTQQLLQGQQHALFGLQKMLTTSLPHELRTPLSGILAPLQMLKEECKTQGNQDILELIDIIDESSERMQRVVERLLIYLKIESLKIEKNTGFEGTGDRDFSDPLYCLQQALESVKNDYPNRHRDIKVDLGFELDRFKTPPPKQLVEQMFLEIIDNACKFSQQGQPIHIRTSSASGNLQIEISDMGCGLSASDFESSGAFIQFNRQANEQQGIGIGLAIANGVVDLIPGAKLERTNNSELGQGTSMIFKLPA